MQEEAIRMREKAEKMLTKAKAAPTVPKSTKEAQLQSEVDKCMVRFRKIPPVEVILIACLE